MNCKYCKKPLLKPNQSQIHKKCINEYNEWIDSKKLTKKLDKLLARSLKLLEKLS